MSRKIIFRDGVFFDDRWNTINPTEEEFDEIRKAIWKYESIKKEVTV